MFPLKLNVNRYATMYIFNKLEFSSVIFNQWMQLRQDTVVSHYFCPVCPMSIVEGRLSQPPRCYSTAVTSTQPSLLPALHSPFLSPRPLLPRRLDSKGPPWNELKILQQDMAKAQHWTFNFKNPPKLVRDALAPPVIPVVHYRNLVGTGFMAPIRLRCHEI